MRVRSSRVRVQIGLIGLLALLVPTQGRSVDFPLLKPPATLFRAHREKFLAKLPPNSIAILHATPLKTMSND
ncbi:MAG TPA: hypothetical protein VF958_01325, partial [Thermoanaerobaculia bacterium]